MKCPACPGTKLPHPSPKLGHVGLVPVAGDPKIHQEMAKGEEKEVFGEGKGLTRVCCHPAGLCLHRAVSPGELPDVILNFFWG